VVRDRTCGAPLPVDVVMALTPLLTDREVAELLVVKPDTVRRWAASGRLPSVRLGGRLVRFRSDDVERWIEGQATNGATRLSLRRRPGSVRSSG
jgi:excisionase family DNA binding protein